MQGQAALPVCWLLCTLVLLPIHSFPPLDAPSFFAFLNVFEQPSLDSESSLLLMLLLCK